MAKKSVKKLLSVIILSWNTREMTMDCLRSLKRDRWFFKNGEVIVVDNASTDGSGEMIKKDFPWVRLICNQENLGFARANNQGIAEATGRYLMLLNSDTLVKKGALERLVERLESDQSIDIIGPKLLNSDGSPQASCGRFPNLWVSFVMLFKEHFGGSGLVRCSPDRSKPVEWLMGSAIIARRAVFEKIGGLDEGLFMYMEEVEWFYRAHKAGFKAFFLKEAEIVHLGQGSSSSGRKGPIINIYKGLIHFYRKHKSPAETIILRLMLKLKAALAWGLGWLKRSQYLKETYAEAFKIS